MGKKLSEMTLEELWTLFPIKLVNHDLRWREWFLEEKRALQLLFAPCDPRINHIGSTAIPSIYAKPTVDILLEFDEPIEMRCAAQVLPSGTYIKMSETENRYVYNKGYTENGYAERVFHFHFCLRGDNDELYFRDYLLRYPTVAKEYEKLKLSLWEKYEHDRDGYTAAKTEFVQKYTAIAKIEFKNKY